MGDSGQHVLVTGGAGDIGAAIGRRALADGAWVTLLDLGDEDVVAAAEDMTWARSARVRYVQGDVTDRVGMDTLLAGLPDIDVAVANAGIVRSAPFLDITAADWQAHLSVNLTGVFNTVQACAQLMVQRGHGGTVICTSSWVGSVPWPEIAAYSVTKAGVDMLVRSAARELAPHRIRVNAVAPGIVEAGLAKRQLQAEPQYAARVATVIPLERLQTADEVAGIVSFLWSPEAAYLTGSIIVADGGCSLFKFD